MDNAEFGVRKTLGSFSGFLEFLSGFFPATSFSQLLQVLQE